MRPVAAAGPGVEVQRPGVLQHVSRRIGIGDQPAHIGAAVAIGEVHPDNIILAGEQIAVPEIKPGLKSVQLTVRARIGESLVSVVHLLTEEAGPNGVGSCTRRGRVRRAAEPLVQGAE